MESKLDFVPENDVEIDDFDKALKFKKMIEAFNEDEDVESVSSNEILSEELEKEVESLRDENESLWFMLEEIQESDKAAKKVMDEQKIIEMLSQMEPVGDA